MKLTCSRESLFSSINIVSKAVSGKTTLPILECILLCADKKNGFKLFATDLEIGIESVQIEADIVEEGSVAVDARKLYEIISKFQGTDVFLFLNKNNSLTISCGGSEINISGFSGSEFPSIPDIEKEKEYFLKQLDLKNMIRQTVFSISQDSSRPVFTGELLEIGEGFVDLVSVDGYRISYKKAVSWGEREEKKIIIPGKTLNEIGKILSADAEKTVSICITEKHVLFDIDGNKIVSRLLEGEFIKYEQSFTSDYKTKVSINKRDFLSALERAMILSRDTRKMPVQFNIINGKIIMTASNETDNIYEEIFAETDGESLKIAFNPKFLIDALKAIDEENVYIIFNTALSPCIIKSEDNEDFKYLILPLRL